MSKSFWWKYTTLPHTIRNTKKNRCNLASFNANQLGLVQNIIIFTIINGILLSIIFLNWSEEEYTGNFMFLPYFTPLKWEFLNLQVSVDYLHNPESTKKALEMYVKHLDLYNSIYINLVGWMQHLAISY